MSKEIIFLLSSYKFICNAAIKTLVKYYKWKKCSKEKETIIIYQSHLIYKKMEENINQRNKRKKQKLKYFTRTKCNQAIN